MFARLFGRYPLVCTALAYCHPRAAAAQPERFPADIAGRVAARRRGDCRLSRHQSLPKPLAYHASITAPGVTALAEELLPESLHVVFAAELDTAESQARFQQGAPGVARLELIGQELPAGIRLEPALPGTWSWHDENTLLFKPARDWPADKPTGCASSPPFSPGMYGSPKRPTRSPRLPSRWASSNSSSPSEDPRDPQQRNAVATLSFSHPVNPQAGTTPGPQHAALGRVH